MTYCRIFDCRCLPVYYSPYKHCRRRVDRSPRATVQLAQPEEKEYCPQDRRNDYDVTNTVQVSNPAVGATLCTSCSGSLSRCLFRQALARLLRFRAPVHRPYPGYNGCDTTYHDVQHTLDMTLALARLVAGYERSVEHRQNAWAHDVHRWRLSPRCFTTRLYTTRRARREFREWRRIYAVSRIAQRRLSASLPAGTRYGQGRRRQQHDRALYGL